MSRLVLAAMVAYGALFTWFTTARDARLGAGILDLGIHDQTVWLASRGLDPYLTSRGLSAFADHFSPVAWVLAPFYWGPASLLALQAFATASGAWPVFRLALRRSVSPGLAAALAGLYLLHPVVQWQNVFDFHFVVLTTPLFLWALLFLEEERPFGYYACLVTALLCGEAVGFTLLALAWTVRSAGTAVLGAAGLVVAAVSMRLASGGAPSQYASLYPTSAEGALQVLLLLFSEDTLNLFLVLLLPLALLPLGSPRRLVPALPVLLGNLLSWRSSQHDFHFHYEAAVLPFLFWAAADALPRLPRAAWVLSAAALVGWLLGPLAPWRGLPDTAPPAWPEVPAEASVSAENPSGARFSARRGIYLFPNPFQSAAWGNRPQALAETASNQVAPLEPGALRRAAEDAGVDYVVFTSGVRNACPVSDPDRHHYLGVLLTWYGVHHAGPGAVILRRGAPRWTGPAPALEDQ